MDEREVWAALERGGAVRQASAPESERGEVLRVSKYNGLLDPSGSAALFDALAERLAGHGASLVAVWEDVEDVLLGYVVGRHLGLPVLRTYNADGLVGHSGPMPNGARAILVTDTVRDAVGMRAVRALLDRSDGKLLGVAALVDSGLSEEPLLASLVGPAAERPRRSDPGEGQHG